MSQHVTAIYENGVLKPLEPLDLRDQQIVSLAIDESPREEEQLQASTLFDVFDEVDLVGYVDGAPSDLSTNPKYLEGFGRSDR